MYVAQIVRDNVPRGTLTAMTLTTMRTMLLSAGLLPTEEPLVWSHMYENLTASIHYVDDELWYDNGTF